ncbi:hypothetical protein TRFO_31683 [Tritrichomonas foetus]|uniref:Tubby C-terminal domain-containing protein n=1 Tax=Tritrichomonas foetus TaxID=1144522 RepID=A0A1J4JW28_9EUKA|nr:hypothetical protein TRFO_31683 [Tritrichomonas foetus]|eukprot:OHT01493.1 hypothetical protein TRFO_31683 [Tritrichomonas foetus]
MSIPSIRFKAPPRKPGQPKPLGSNSNMRRTTRTRTGHGKLYSVDFSSDSNDADDDLDELPVLKTKPKASMIEIPQSDSDDDVNGYSGTSSNNGDYNDDNNDKPPREVNWQSKSGPPANFRPRAPSQPRQRIRRNHGSIKSTSSINDSHYHNHSAQNDDENYGDGNSGDGNDVDGNVNNEEPQQHRRRVRRVKRRSIQPQQTTNYEDEDDEDLLESDEVNISKNSRQNYSTSNSNQVVNDNNSLQRNRSRTLERFRVPHTHTSDEIEIFTVVRELKKSAKKNHADFRMMKEEQAIFFSLASKDEIGQIDIISTSMPVMPNSKDNVGIIRKQNGKRFTLITNEEKENDDRESERIGLAFVKLPSDVKTKQKTFRIAIRDHDRPNYPISKRMELARLAENADEVNNIKYYTNKLPTIGPDGKPTNVFGSTFVIDSIKNYIITDENDETIYMIYKSSEGSYTVKAKYPISPIMAFSLSVSIIQDCH